MNYDNAEKIVRIVRDINDLDNTIRTFERLMKYIKSGSNHHVAIHWEENESKLYACLPKSDNFVENLVVQSLEVLHAQKEKLKQSLLPL